MDNSISPAQGANLQTPERRDGSAQPAKPDDPDAAARADRSQAAEAPDAAIPSPAPDTGAAEPAEVLRETVERVSERLNEFVADISRDLEFRVDDDNGDVVILVRESATGEIVRTIPPDEARQLAENLEINAAALVSGMA